MESVSELVQSRRKGADARCIAHALHSASNNHVLVAGRDALRRQHDRLHPTSADLVDRGRVRAGLHARTERDLTRWRLADTSLHDIAEVDLLSGGGVDSVRLEGVLESGDTELGCSQGLERTVEGADRCAACSDNDNFVCLVSLENY